MELDAKLGDRVVRGLLRGVKMVRLLTQSAPFLLGIRLRTAGTSRAEEMSSASEGKKNALSFGDEGEEGESS